MVIEILTFWAMHSHSPRSGCPYHAVQFTQPRSIDPPAVIPAEAGIQVLLKAFWIPAYAGMTDQLHREKANLDKSAGTQGIFA
jgi:hypothetical protein